jgi:hypothetical protein
VDDPHLYDLVINTDRISAATTAHIIVSSLRDRLAGLEPAPAPAKPPAAGPAAGAGPGAPPEPSPDI